MILSISYEISLISVSTAIPIPAICIKFIKTKIFATERDYTF
jgi:hypothetical protein